MSGAILLDTGPLVALLDRRDHWHDWARRVAAKHPPPWRTCDAVVTEACFLLRALPTAVDAIWGLVQRGPLHLDFRLGDEHQQVRLLMNRYRNVPMSLADACLVRMSEDVDDCHVLTIDSDFHIYRRHRRRKIPLIFPPSV